MISPFRKLRLHVLNNGELKKYLRYALGEITLVVIGILIALTLNTWKERRHEREIEAKILQEIYNGLELDIEDMELNMRGHKRGLRAADVWNRILMGETVDTDSIFWHYHYLFRDFTSIQNSSGYDYLKSKGFELIRSDSLRIAINQLYDQRYQSLRKMEESSPSMQFHSSYFDKIQPIIAPYLILDKEGRLENVRMPLVLGEQDAAFVRSMIYKIAFDRRFVLRHYDQTILLTRELQQKIIKELANF